MQHWFAASADPIRIVFSVNYVLESNKINAIKLMVLLLAGVGPFDAQGTGQPHRRQQGRLLPYHVVQARPDLRRN